MAWYTPYNGTPFDAEALGISFRSLSPRLNPLMCRHPLRWTGVVSCQVIRELLHSRQRFLSRPLHHLKLRPTLLTLSEVLVRHRVISGICG